MEYNSILAEKQNDVKRIVYGINCEELYLAKAKLAEDGE